MSAAGVVCELGDSQSTAAAIAQRLNIPAVLSVPNAFELLKEGEKVTVDSERGIVTTENL